MMSFTQDGSSHTAMYSLHFYIVEGSGDVHLFFTVYEEDRRSVEPSLRAEEPARRLLNPESGCWI